MQAAGQTRRRRMPVRNVGVRRNQSGASTLRRHARDWRIWSRPCCYCGDVCDGEGNIDALAPNETRTRPHVALPSVVAAAAMDWRVAKWRICLIGNQWSANLLLITTLSGDGFPDSVMA